MPIFSIGGAILGGSLISGLIGSNAAQGAAQTQANAQMQGSQIQQNMFNTITGQEQPFLQGGYGAESTLQQLLGIGGPNSVYQQSQPVAQQSQPTYGGMIPMPVGEIMPQQGQQSSASALPASMVGNAMPGYQAGNAGMSGGMVGNTGLPAGYLTQTFNPTQQQLEQYPGYQFALQQGGQAIRNADTPGLGALSGAALKNLMGFDVGTANTYYGNYFNQFQQQQQNIFNRLSGIAGLGQNAAGNLGNAGTQLGTGIAQSTAAAGASQAAGQIGSANALTGAMNNGMNYWMMNSMINNSN